MNHYKITFKVYDLPYEQAFLVRAEDVKSAVKRFHRDCKAKVLKIEEVEPQRGQSYAEA